MKPKPSCYPSSYISPFFFEVKSFGYKYDSLSTFNSTLKLICHGGLPTYIPFILEVCEILYLSEDAKPPKKMKKNYETSQKFQNT